MRLTDIKLPDEVDQIPPHMAAHPEGASPSEAGTPRGYPTHHRFRDGTIIDVEVTSKNVELDGRDCRIAIFVDVTERNKTSRELVVAVDRAVEASNMKSAF